VIHVQVPRQPPANASSSATAKVSSRRTGGSAARAADTVELTRPIDDVPILGQIDLNQSVQLPVLTAILFRPFVFTIGDRLAPLRRGLSATPMRGQRPFRSARSAIGP
jgi:hypothetical protein